MGKVAFLFPGQGSQRVGMGRAAYETSREARTVFEDADAALGIELSALCFEGPEDKLQLTTNTQPAIVTTSIALLRGLGERCDVAAGHSLGEYSAHVCAGTLDFDDAVRLVHKRGKYMQDAVPVGEGAMAVVLGGEVAAIEAACAATGGVEPVNYNCPGQLVIAGESAAVQRAVGALEALGAKARLLPVSAPFHCSLMLPAEARLAPELLATRLHEPSVPVYTNVDAVPVTTATDARDALLRQVSRPVRWQRCIERMLADGVALFVEIGEGRALTGMLRRVDRRAKCCNVETPDDFDAARLAIAQERARVA